MARSLRYLRFTSDQMQTATEMPRSVQGLDQPMHFIYYEV